MCVGLCVSWQDVQGHAAFLFLQDGHGLLVRRPLQVLPVHCQQLIAALQPAIHRGGTLQQEVTSSR